MTTTTVVVGNPKPRSRTYDTAVSLAHRLTGRPPEATYDLVDFGPALLDWTAPEVADAVQVVTSSSLVIFASPTYKASYTGLLKLFLDRFSAGQLDRVVAVPLMLGGHWQHALAGEVHLKPVLAEIGAMLPTKALYLIDSELDDSPALTSWLESAVPRLSALGVLP